MAMSSKYANTWSTTPRNRYKHGKQVYHYDSPRSVIVVCDSETRNLNKVPGIEISAGMLLINGIPVSVDGTLSVPRVHSVSHVPGEGAHGYIELQTENVI